MIVVDLGCALIGGEESTFTLARRFRPRLLYGFDPLLMADRAEQSWRGTRIVRERQAAWTHGGELTLSAGKLIDATALRTSERWIGSTELTAPCFDFAAWLRRLLETETEPGEPVVVKVDVEGAEFRLLRAIHKQRLDRRLDRILVEWHERFLPPFYRDYRAWLERVIVCPIEEWH